MEAPELAVVDVRRTFLLSLTEGAQAGVPLVEDKLHKTNSLALDENGKLTVPIQVKHLMLLLEGRMKESRSRGRRKDMIAKGKRPLKGRDSRSNQGIPK